MCARPGFFRPVFCWPKAGREARTCQRPQQHKYRPETRLVQSGILRSQFGETSEALFLTQGYVYDDSAQAEARFKGEDPGYQYSRFANPTVNMFEQRMAAFEGAEAARAVATGMAAVTLALIGQVKAGDHIVASKAIFGSCLYVMEDPALAVRRDVGGAVPHPGLRLRQFRAGRGPLQGRGPRLPVLALRQSDRRHVRAAHRRIRGRGSGARDSRPAWPR